MNRRRLAFTVIAAAAVLSAGGVALYFSPKAEPGSTQPPIAWTPGQLVLTLTPGESRQLQVTANVRSAIPAVVTEVVPALAPYVSVSPAALSPMGAGATQVLDLTVNVPAGTAFQTIDGTLHLRAGDSTVARPLPVSLNIWPRLAGEGVSYNVPPDWTQENLPGTDVEPPLTAATSPLGSRIVVEIQADRGFGLPEETVATHTQVLIDGYPAVRGDYKDSSGGVFLSLVRFDPPLATLPAFLVQFRPVTGDPGAEVVFEQVLRTIDIQ